MTNSSPDFSQGKRTLAEHLDLGLFTQDLAQELPLDREALTVVLEHAQKKDPTILAEVSCFRR
jgi:hypothetical protein